MTDVPPPSFGPSGFTSPEELAILAGVLADMNAAFGGNLNPSVSTPQGQWATSLAAVIGASNDLFVDFTNQVDPAFASGRMQDAIARIYYLTRRGATPSLSYGQKIRLRSTLGSPANGDWIVANVTHNLDAEVPGGQWFTHVECGRDGYPTPVIG